jgi:hypothetical protein
MDTLHVDVFTFLTISRWFFVRMGNISNKSCIKNQNRHFMFRNFFSENHAFMIRQKMWRSQRGCRQMAHARLMLDKWGYTRVSTRLHPWTHTHARTRKYVILISFPRKNAFVNAPQCYVTRTWPVLLWIWHYLSTDSMSRLICMKSPRSFILLCLILTKQKGFRT